MWEISFARSVIRTVTKHLHNNIRCTKNFSAFRENFPSLCRVLVIEIAGLGPRTRLEYNFQSCLG